MNRATATDELRQKRRHAKKGRNGTTPTAPQKAQPDEQAQPTAFRYRMKELCELSGLSRQAIHFYIRTGLLPEGRKAGRNMAYYSDEHVQRLALIRRLQHERMLPLKAIKALFDEHPGGFDDSQRAMLGELKSRLSLSLRGGRARATVDAKRVAGQLGVTMKELRRMAKLGLVDLVRKPRGQLEVATDSVWLLELWSRLRALGFDAKLGFSVEDLALYERSLRQLFEKETELVLQRLVGHPVEKVAAMVEAALPLVHTFMAFRHTTLVRNVFAAIQE